MVEVVVGTSDGVIVLPDPARCPRHPAWHIAVRWGQTRRTDGTWKHKITTGACPECGWEPDIPGVISRHRQDWTEHEQSVP